MGYNYEPCNGFADPAFYAELHANSKRMRSQATTPEYVLWKCLRGKQLGVKFRRQHPIGEFIADFICLSEMLIIEVDGGYHLEKSQIEADKLRTEKLNALGYRVIRFSNDEVLYNTQSVLEAIYKHIRFSELY